MFSGIDLISGINCKEPPPKDVPNIRPKRRGAKNKTIIPDIKEENNDKQTHQGCEVMHFLPFPKSNGRCEQGPYTNNVDIQGGIGQIWDMYCTNHVDK